MKFVGRTMEEKRYRARRFDRWADWFIFGAIDSWWALAFWLVTGGA